MKKFKVKSMVIDAVLIALYFVLSYFVSINLGNMKITLDGLPILVGALLFGPVDGLIIGLMGSFLNQLMSYGITATTILWILPAAVRGLMVGAYAKHKGFKLKQSQLIFIIVLSALVVTTLNTGVMYVDSKIYGYYSYAFVFGMLIPRYISGIITGVLFSVIMPTLLRLIRKNVRL